jgi:hypothetical protein
MLVNVYRDNAVKETAVYKWGRESITVKVRSGQPAKSRIEENIAKVCQIVHEIHRLSVRCIAE